MSTDTPKPLPTCANCGRAIGMLETKYTWQGHTVCYECQARLTAQNAPAVAPSSPPSTPPSSPVIPAHPATMTPATAPAAPEHEPETVVFEGHPSLLSVLGYLVLCGAIVLLGLSFLFAAFQWGAWSAWLGLVLLLLGGGMFLTRYLQLRFVHYRLSSQRLFLTTGILAKRTVEVELFRIRDLSVEQSLLQRMLNIGTIHAVTTDADVPRLEFFGIRNPLGVKEMLRKHVMESRQRTRTRDLDVADFPSL